ncbi:MAG: glycerol-3-phosphate dehydrogenase [Comamonadaceae bacterium BICA1-1]|nr:MAG: glycerol-3-phosphate dehydrogenase [Comamonadaceae bacterium BICA1-1]
MNITLLGAGAWGTALAIAATRTVGASAGAAVASGSTQRVRLWARDPAQVAAMQVARCNARYLPGCPFPAALELFAADEADLAQLCAGEDLIILGTPMAALRGLLHRLRGLPVPVVWLCKGFEQHTGLLGHEIALQEAPDLAVGVLSGPSFAKEVAAAAPTALVAASSDACVSQRLVAALHSRTLRVYANDDVVGVEVGGAVKNVLAIATGLCDGLQLGHNARAALITRGLAETVRLGLALGARAETFMGLSGLGDLVLTATGDLSRNRQVGLRLAQGQSLQQALDALGHVAEGVYSARTVAQRARALGVDMPITQAVVALLNAELSPAQAVQLLMGREPTPERP